MCSLEVSLDLFAKAGGIEVLRQRSQNMISYLIEMLSQSPRVTFITPEEEQNHGGHLAILIDGFNAITINKKL